MVEQKQIQKNVSALRVFVNLMLMSLMRRARLTMWVEDFGVLAMKINTEGHRRGINFSKGGGIGKKRETPVQTTVRCFYPKLDASFIAIYNLLDSFFHFNENTANLLTAFHLYRLAPECLEQKKFTHHSDIWSLGVTLWEMFSYGERPYDNWKIEYTADVSFIPSFVS